MASPCMGMVMSRNNEDGRSTRSYHRLTAVEETRRLQWLNKRKKKTAIVIGTRKLERMRGVRLDYRWKNGNCQRWGNSMEAREGRGKGDWPTVVLYAALEDDSEAEGRAVMVVRQRGWQ